MKAWQDNDSCETDTADVESAIPLIKDDNAWVVHAERVKTLSETTKRGAVMLVTCTALVLCIVFFFVCPNCMFGVLLVSACMCPWFHSMNAPLWLAIVLLTVSGWSLTAGFLSVTWTMH